MCFHKSIATRECLASQGISVDTSCPICQQAPEFILHTLRDCTVAANCWHNLGGDAVGVDFFSLNLRDWLKKYCCQDVIYGSNQMAWSKTFAFGIWILWQHRNRIVFQNQSPNQSIHKEVMKKATEFALCAQSVSANRTRVER